MAGVYGGFTSSAEFIDGARGFHPISYCLRIPKTLILRCYWQPYLLSMVLHEGGALEVGKASTVAFVWTSVSIILSIILTQ
jgi:phospholipid/cholesterol/gamma-HCH transport system permease protein